MTELAVELRHAKRNNSTQIDLSNRMLTVLPKDLFLLKHLVSLNLSHNKIEHVSPQIVKLQKLEFLDLQNNQIMELPKEMVELNELKELKVKGNPLKSQFSGLLNIKYGQTLWQVLSDCFSYQQTSPYSTPSWLAESNNNNSHKNNGRSGYQPSRKEVRYSEQKQIGMNKKFSMTRKALKIEQQQQEKEKEIYQNTLHLSQQQLQQTKQLIQNPYFSLSLGTYCGLQISIKKLNKHEHTPAQFANQIYMLNKYRHPFILTLIGAVPPPVNWIITQSIQYSLHQLLTLKRGKVNMKFREKCAKQIVLAVSHLHQHGILHRNITSSSVFIDGVGNIKLGDFSVAVHQSQQYKQKSVPPKSPSIYVAPQLLDTSEYTKQSDIFALGTLLYQLFSSPLPYEGKTSQQILKKYLNEDQLPFKQEIPEPVYNTINLCRRAKVEQRPAVTQLLNSKIFDL